MKGCSILFLRVQISLRNLAKIFSPCFSRELNRAWQLSSSASSPRLDTTTSSTASAHAMTDLVHIPARTGETHTCGAAPTCTKDVSMPPDTPTVPARFALVGAASPAFQHSSEGNTSAWQALNLDLILGRLSPSSAPQPCLLEGP